MEYTGSNSRYARESISSLEAHVIARSACRLAMRLEIPISPRLSTMSGVPTIVFGVLVFTLQ
jgi:hypothetical protein